jgi:hypothetical protein
LQKEISAKSSQKGICATKKVPQKHSAKEFMQKETKHCFEKQKKPFVRNEEKNRRSSAKGRKKNPRNADKESG